MAQIKDKVKPKYVLRDLVLANGGKMDIVPDVLRSRQFKGWLKSDIYNLTSQLRQEPTDGEIWAIYGGCIYGLKKTMPDAIVTKKDSIRATVVGGMAKNNIAFNYLTRERRQEKAAKKALSDNSKILAKTIDSSYRLISTLDTLLEEDGNTK